MALLATCKDHLVVSSGSTFIAIDTKDSREPFVYDCSKADKKPQGSENKGDEGGSEEKGSDKILSFAFSSSGDYFALTDDNKRLILFCTKPSWECLSTRWVVRRCTSLVVTQSEDHILVADKSGDVYSFSVSNPQKPSELKLGHLSMLLSVAVSPDGKYIITADRDEKIRVSLLKAPYDIQSFCLGHREFVSSVFVPPHHPHWLISGSGDGTLRLWDIESGTELQNLDLKQLNGPDSTEKDKFAVSRIASSPQGDHIAVSCDSFPAVHIFQVDVESQMLVHMEHLRLAHSSWDVAFSQAGKLWLLQQNQDTPATLYTLTDGHWQCEPKDPEVKRLTEVVHAHWDMFQDSIGAESCYHNLYKVVSDNMATYLQKKQERIQQQGTKRGKPLPQSRTTLELCQSDHRVLGHLPD
ncbi:tRNA (guanine-N(7)-)-methyltransferase non-catalytic subunit wdr4 isoform X2 [Amia ocellicauda]|uniref:tRNA (guanine-N(7)-)-methyltransferase non-catalytic subunit wdr4 isoform X2 n=1 Tax=Amia ocellicauda TaxID=2972642 RepID=UPI003463C488